MVFTCDSQWDHMQALTTGVQLSAAGSLWRERAECPLLLVDKSHLVPSHTPLCTHDGTQIDTAVLKAQFPSEPT